MRDWRASPCILADVSLLIVSSLLVSHNMYSNALTMSGELDVTRALSWAFPVDAYRIAAKNDPGRGQQEEYYCRLSMGRIMKR